MFWQMSWFWPQLQWKRRLQETCLANDQVMNLFRQVASGCDIFLSSPSSLSIRCRCSLVRTFYMQRSSISMQLGAWVVGKPERISACIDHWLMWDWVKPKRDNFSEWRFIYAMIFLRHDSKFDVRTRAPKVLIHIHISIYYIYIYIYMCVYNYLIWYLSNSPNSVSTLKGSCGRS